MYKKLNNTRMWYKRRKTANSFHFSFFILLSVIYSLLQQKAAN